MSLLGVTPVPPNPPSTGRRQEQISFRSLYHALPVSYSKSLDAYPIDFDGDKKMDFIVTSLAIPITYPATFAPLNALKNQGGCHFADATGKFLGNKSMVHPRHFAMADVNGDHTMDFFMAGHGTDIEPFPGEQSKLFINLKNRKFVDITDTALGRMEEFTFSTNLVDIEGDGDNDLFLNSSDGGGPRFFLNDGKGNFKVDTGRLPLFVSQGKKRHLANLFLDVDSDGDLDLVLGGEDGYGPGSYHSRDTLLFNDGKGLFRETHKNALPKKARDPSWGTVALTHGDYDGDGDQDLVAVTHNYGYSEAAVQLFLNNGKGQFRDASARLPAIVNTGNHWIPWIDTGDFTGDGLPDLLFNFRGPHAIAQNGRAFYLLANQGNAHFADWSSLVPVTDPVLATARFLDCDNDGDLDIFFLRYGLGYYVAIQETHHD